MIGIIGFGRFGKLAARYLSENFDVCVHTRADKDTEIRSVGARAVSLEEVCKQDVIIPCVPISVFKNILKDIAPLIEKDALVVDVCSVKEYPIRWMKEILPDTVSILATHPMFGPDSAAVSLEGCKICLCKVQIPENQYRKIRKYLFSKGIIVIEATGKEHDQQIATSPEQPSSISTPKATNGCCIFWKSSSATPGNCSPICIIIIPMPERSASNLWKSCRTSAQDWSKRM